MVAKLDRLSRSIVNAANIIESAQTQGWSLVILDLGVDLTTAAGRMMAMNLVNFAQYERELISERTKAALAAKKRRVNASDGQELHRLPWCGTSFRPGRPVQPTTLSLRPRGIQRPIATGQTDLAAVHRSAHLHQCHR